ncbi:putative lipid II flippase FtsW [Pseudonocardia sp. RS010]|uniref:putative lipid II flippase FtsW n=1 Tax=Pseudonocardia sp. RS010 TaxID=3385979 RepID=UPI0039A24FB2
MTSLHLLLAVFGLLTLFGLVMVLSASSVTALTSSGSSYSVFNRQLMFGCVGLVAFYIALRVPPHCWRQISPILLLGSIAALIAVLVPGVGVIRNGSRGWFAVGSLSLQPAEIAKLALALWGAHMLAARRKVMQHWRHALSPVLPVSLVMLTLLVLQPDLGGAVSLAIVVGALLYYGGAPARLLAALAVGGAAGAVILGLTAGYRASRINSFLSGDTGDPFGAAYQARQGLYSLADGGLLGVGLGQGRAKWDYLPNAHNDFIFAIIGEELGLIGTFAVLALFGTLTYTGLRIAVRVVDPWCKIVGATATTWLVIQAAINIGYVVGLLPVTGLQLPLISSGGTSLVTSMFTFGLLANLARHEPEAVAVSRENGPGPLAQLLRLPRPVSTPGPTSNYAAHRTAPGFRRPLER